MLLDTTTRKLQLVLTAAMTTANMPVCVYYVDSSASALPVPGMTPTNSNGVTYVDILTAPAASTQRKVNSITVNNADTAAKTVQIYLDDNGTDYLLCAATLQVGDVLGYTDTRGWYVNDSAGNLKVTPTNAISALLVTNTPAGNIAAINVQTAINELDTEKMAIATYDADANGVVDLAETVVILCRNTTGVTISKMAVVYISGASGQNPTIALAKADAEATSSKTIGVVTADITNNSTGFVALLGELHDYDTSAFADGNTLWLSATVAGGMTATRPTAPNHAVLIGFVAYSHVNNGKIALNVTNGQEMAELHDVLITSIADNQLLQYDSASGTWKNRSTLAGLTFTAPILGTPASGDLRNCSLAVAPAIGGTTPAAGAFTTLSASGNTTLGDASTDNVRINGYAAANTAPDASIGLYLYHASLSTADQYGEYCQLIGTSGGTTGVTAFNAQAGTAAASYTCADAIALRAANAAKGAGSTITNLHGLYIANQTQGANNYGITNAVSAGANKWGYYGSGAANNAFVGSVRIGSTVAPTVALDVTGAILAANSILSSGATQGIGYTTGSGGTVTQITSRTTGVAINKINGEIALVSAAGSATWQSFTVTNSAMAATDHVVVNQKSGTDKYLIHVTAKAAGSFEVTFATTGGTTTEQPVFGFEIHKGTAA